MCRPAAYSVSRSHERERVDDSEFRRDFPYVAIHRLPLSRSHLFLNRAANAIDNLRLRALKALRPPVSALTLIGNQAEEPMACLCLGSHLPVTLWTKRRKIAHVSLLIFPAPANAENVRLG